MNNSTVQTKIAELKKADLAAYNAGVKSNHLINFLREETIKRAFTASADLSVPVTIEMNMTVASYVAPSLALLTKPGQYPALLKKAKMEFINGDIKFTYTVNADGLSPEYRQKLNEKLQIGIPVLEEVV